jgi:hypothetical protein
MITQPICGKAGMKRIVEQNPPKEAEKIMKVLEGLGFAPIAGQRPRGREVLNFEERRSVCRR